MPLPYQQPALYAGFGCRRGCPMDTLDKLLLQTLEAHGLALGNLRGIASIGLKADEPGLQQLAAHHALPLVFFDTVRLQQFEPLLSHRSERSHTHSGCWGVAESAALALAFHEQGSARLCVPRHLFGPATLALACAG